MTNSKHTKRALLASVLSVVMCVAMLVGTTFAWFTDSVTSGGNKIMAGNLKADLIHVDDGKDVSIQENPDHKIFDYDKWEPNYTVMETLKVVNNGNLAFKFRLDAVAAGATAGPKGEKLADVIDVYVYEGTDNPADTTSFAEMTEANGWRNAGSLSKLMADPDGIAHGELLPIGATSKNGEPVGSVQMTVALHMQETAGNAYQGLTLGDLNFTLNATQYTFEDDSFGNDYDENADWPAIDEPEFPVPGPGEEKEVSDQNGLNGAISNDPANNPDRIFIELNNTDPINTAIGNAAVRYLTKTTVIRSADGTEKVLSANDKTGAFRFGDKSFDESGVSNLYLDNVTIEAMKRENQNYTGIRLGSGTGSGLANKTINVVGGTFKTDCNEGSDQTNASYRSGAFVVYNSQNVTINFTNVNFEFSDWAALVHEYDTAGKTNCANNTYNFINCTFTYVKSDGTKEVLAIDSWDDWAAKYLPDGVGSGTDPISGMFRPTKTSNSTFNFS